MTDLEFKNALDQFKFYLKPQMFAALVEASDAFNDETKKEIIAKLQEADNQMRELHEYQEKRESILKKGLNKMTDIYENMKSKYQQLTEKDQQADSTEAEELITNLQS